MLITFIRNALLSRWINMWILRTLFTLSCGVERLIVRTSITNAGLQLGVRTCELFTCLAPPSDSENTHRVTAFLNAFLSHHHWVEIVITCCAWTFLVQELEVCVTAVLYAGSNTLIRVEIFGAIWAFSRGLQYLSFNTGVLNTFSRVLVRIEKFLTGKTFSWVLENLVSVTCINYARFSSLVRISKLITFRAGSNWV